MTKEIAQAILLLLNRVQIQGSEVPAFTKIVETLNSIQNETIDG